MNSSPHPVTGILLAGGLSRRFGPVNKVNAPFCGGTLVEWAVARIRPQVTDLIIAANGNVSLPPGDARVLAQDLLPGHRGPLAGLLTGIEWAKTHGLGTRYFASFAVDAPLMPANLVERLAAVSLTFGVPAIAASNGRPHPVFGFWPENVAQALRRFVVTDGQSRAIDFARGCGAREVNFPDNGMDPFFNVNRPESLGEAEAFLRRKGLCRGA